MQRWDCIDDLDETEQAGARIIGAGVRGARLSAGLSQRQLAWRCGLHQSIISRLETGRLRLEMRFIAPIQRLFARSSQLAPSCDSR